MIAGLRDEAEISVEARHHGLLLYIQVEGNMANAVRLFYEKHDPSGGQLERYAVGATH